MHPYSEHFMVQGGVFSSILLVALAVLWVWTGVSFVIHFYDTATITGRPAPSPRTYLAAWFREWVAGLFTAILFPFELFPNSTAYDPNGGRPIVFVHGYGMNRTSMWWLCWQMKQRGWKNIYTTRIGSTRTDIHLLAERLATELKELRNLTGGEVPYIIAHSMGGLISRAMLELPNAPKARKLICLGTPHRGTRIAVFGHGTSANQMLPGSSFLNDLDKNSSIPIISFWAPLDAFILPAESAQFGTRVIQISDGGHGFMLISEEVADSIEGILRADKQETGTTTSSELIEFKKNA